MGLSIATLVAFDRFAVDESTFLAIFIPATVGVLGSYGLYLKRRVDNTRRLRKALRSELEGMTWVRAWPSDGQGVPVFDPVPSQVYEGNADALGLLTDTEVTHIVEFYSRAEVTGEILGYHGDRKIEADTSFMGQDLGEGDREDAIEKGLDRLALSYQRALLTVQQELDETERQIPALSTGKVVTEDHPVVEDQLVLCADYGLLVQDEEDQIQVTEKGAAFFEGELSAADLDKEYDVLRRDEGWTDRVKRGLVGLVGDASAGQSS
ncbi:hypothetical protein [Halobacterium wangiae]|uniref:hypothetical protein n=1 Tax=Halobacterium wangiae TaxID=2902623 RepID=UPI001E553429|nr:hypothetical protein [Halobacterium wangiae]